MINYDLPYNAEDYVHRTGRAGASGDALSVYSDKDERLLVDIEKLIKQSITRGELAGFTPAPARGRDSERPAARDAERRSRRPEGESFARPASASADRGPRSAGMGGPPRRDKVDPWFNKPYESASTPRAEVTPLSAAPVKPGKQKVAALLGGLPKR